MARSDLLKRLFRGYKIGDRKSFMEAALEIVEDEKKKSHDLLANELLRILEYGSSSNSSSYQLSQPLETLPKDSDKGSTLIELRETKRYLADLILSDLQMLSINDILLEFRQWDVLEANGLRASNKLLFCGPPGCGKTATAEAIATELGLPLLYVRFDSVISSLLGETASNLRKVFEYASRGSWVILFDEFDAIGRSRDDASEHGELKRVVNSFLQLLDRYSGRSLVIAATNFEQALDPALWRRFDEIIRFDRPNEQQIESLLKKRLGHLRVPNIKLTNMGQKLIGMSHAEVERVSYDILRNSVINGITEISDKVLNEAFKKQERRKQSLIRSQGNRKPSVDKDM